MEDDQVEGLSGMETEPDGNSAVLRPASELVILAKKRGFNATQQYAWSEWRISKMGDSADETTARSRIAIET